MPVRDIVLYPDPRLKQVCAHVGAELGSQQIQQLGADLLDTMDSFPGCVGIAAPQVGAMVRMVAVDVTGHRKAESCHGRVVLVDPQLEAGEGSCVMREGCLSIPDFTANVRRAQRVRLHATALDGSAMVLDCDAYEARVVLHELDHLEGLLFLDRVDSAKDVFPRKRYQ